MPQFSTFIMRRLFRQFWSWC